MHRDFSEERLVEPSAIGLFAELGWTKVPAESFGATGTPLRERKGDVVSGDDLNPTRRSPGAPTLVNPALLPEVITFPWMN